MYLSVQHRFRNFTNGKDDEVVVFPPEQMFGMKLAIYMVE